MLFERLRVAGITMILAAAAMVAWKVGVRRWDVGPELRLGREELRSEMTIPIEIVEAGEDPRADEVRIHR